MWEFVSFRGYGRCFFVTLIQSKNSCCTPFSGSILPINSNLSFEAELLENEGKRHKKKKKTSTSIKTGWHFAICLWESIWINEQETSLTFPMQDSHVQVRVTVEGLQLLEQTPRRLLVHRITHLRAVYPHGNHAPPALCDHSLSRN